MKMRLTGAALVATLTLSACVVGGPKQWWVDGVVKDLKKIDGVATADGRFQAFKGESISMGAVLAPEGDGQSIVEALSVVEEAGEAPASLSFIVQKPFGEMMAGFYEPPARMTAADFDATLNSAAELAKLGATGFSVGNDPEASSRDVVACGATFFDLDPRTLDDAVAVLLDDPVCQTLTVTQDLESGRMDNITLDADAGSLQLDLIRDARAIAMTGSMQSLTIDFTRPEEPPLLLLVSPTGADGDDSVAMSEEEFRNLLELIHGAGLDLDLIYNGILVEAAGGVLARKSFPDEPTNGTMPAMREYADQVIADLNSQ